jgi:hypothetical protein
VALRDERDAEEALKIEKEAAVRMHFSSFFMHTHHIYIYIYSSCRSHNLIYLPLPISSLYFGL